VQTSHVHYTTVTLFSTSGASTYFDGGVSAWRVINASAAASMLSFFTLIKAFLHYSNGKPMSFNWDKYNSFGSIGFSSFGGLCFFFGFKLSFWASFFSSSGFLISDSFSIRAKTFFETSSPICSAAKTSSIQALPKLALILRLKSSYSYWRFANTYEEASASTSATSAAAANSLNIALIKSPSLYSKTSAVSYLFYSGSGSVSLLSPGFLFR